MQYLETYYYQNRYAVVGIALLIVFTFVMNMSFRISVNRCIRARSNQLRNMRKLETHIRNERKALERERYASERERMQWNTDYRIYCARFECKNKR